VFATGNDPFIGEWEDLQAKDPFVKIKTTGKPGTQPYSPEDELFSFAFVALSALTISVNGFVSSAMGRIILEESDPHPFPRMLRINYDRLSTEKKVVVQALSGLHGSGIVLPLLLVMGIIRWPVFLRQPGADEAFYIRVGPSSNAKDISEALKYIEDHFGGH
jgi:hypothetical protein